MSRSDAFGEGRSQQAMPKLKGKALIEHMSTHHGFVTWKTPHPTSREGKQWARSHDEEYHGRWADQSEHHHA